MAAINPARGLVSARLARAVGIALIGVVYTTLAGRR